VNGNSLGGAIIDPHYHTPYAIHATAGIQHAFNDHWILGADYTHETGMHGYRAYSFPDLDLFKSDNRSSYDGLMIRLQGNTRRASLIAHYTLSSAKTWGCVLGELWDYVNGVCHPLNPFGPGDYGPSGEDVRSRFVVSGIFHAPGGFEVSTLTQAESARPFTITATTAEGTQRITVDEVPTSLDEFRGTPYIQVDLRVARPVKFREGWTVMPFIEFFNLFNRNNPGANYVTNEAALPLPASQIGPLGVTGITSLKQLEVPAGALGDFFGPGTTVGIPFAAQLGVRVSF